MANASIKPSGANQVDYITITTGILSASQVTLSKTPVVPANALVEVGGVSQLFGVDYTIVSNIISWHSMGLGSVLSSGDTLKVQYFFL